MHLPVDSARDQAIAVARRAVELGVTLIDTAHLYGGGANEELLASALYPYPDELVITTKVGSRAPDPAASGGSTPGPRSCVSRSSRPGAVFGWSGSTCSSCTASTPGRRSPTSSARCGSSRSPGRSGGSGCPR
ncbi:aldo/keto reductase [Amycolatopsis sp. RTGN1]|uniref:aldo/keto reductase n=1 Tax=Amycolatopsis ponsaeliensis TaxID=2992142 RepID=UPI003306FFC8